MRQSARLFGASEALSKAIQAPVQPWDAFLMRPSLAALREQLDEATFNPAWAEGRAMTYQQAIDTALAQLLRDGL